VSELSSPQREILVRTFAYPGRTAPDQFCPFGMVAISAETGNSSRHLGASEAIGP
jgi:hypothetical protein